MTDWGAVNGDCSSGRSSGSSGRSSGDSASCNRVKRNVSIPKTDAGNHDKRYSTIYGETKRQRNSRGKKK